MDEGFKQRLRDNYWYLRELFASSLKLDHIYLNDGDLKKYGIKVSQLSLSEEEAKTSQAVHFFKPLPSKDFEKLYLSPFTLPPYEPECGICNALGLANHVLESLGDTIPIEKRPSKKKFSVLTCTVWDLAGYGLRTADGLCETRGKMATDYEWRIHQVLSAAGTNEPHIVLFSVHNLVPEANQELTLTRGEITLLLRMILERMESASDGECEIFPVLMVSLFLRHVRLVQAYFDGEFLHMKIAPFINLTTYDKGKVDLLLRHILGNPVGNTRMPTKSVLPNTQTPAQAQAQPNPAQKSTTKTKIQSRPAHR
ncbi:hypothetical protein PRK78_004808 [Emydomyces testavorans]|uniref:Uncharacterized protein n=1 Tax=Emydomyces testavorans TaxID=2070801 RepID=A0AAF0IJI8_9EURO|nr:hypothetical protein PRK78_004808 [Emydomyces testavorans]